ncbi:DUF1365 domain-containing protein [Nonomuraea sp. NPDC055795]
MNVYAARLVHVRRKPVFRRFRHNLHLWLIDLDELPDVPWWLRPFVQFRAADHVGAPHLTIRRNVGDWLSAQGVRLGNGRVLMLTTPRTLGRVFNPLTLYWCHDERDELRCVVAEVSNTYGRRHCYLLRPGPGHCAETRKRFYVSPFLSMDGRYRMRLPVPGERLSIRISLVQEESPVLTAVLTGHRITSDTPGILRALLLRPPAPYWVTFLIRRHGIALWLRGLPRFPRTLDPGRRPS